MAAASVQPVPWVFLVAIRAAAKRTAAVAVTRRSTLSAPLPWPPFISTARAPEGEQALGLAHHLVFGRSRRRVEQRRRLRQIRRHHHGQRDKFRAQRLDRIRRKQAVA